MSKRPNPSRPVVERTVSTATAARLLGVHRNTVYSRIQTGDLPAFRIHERAQYQLPVGLLRGLVGKK